MRSVLYSGLGLALALGLVLALGTVLPQPSGVTAAPLPQRTRQPTSNTATPRITLPTDTPAATASPTATGAGPTAVPTGSAAVTDSPLATPPPAGGSPASGGTGQPGGSGSGSLPVGTGTATTPGAEGGTVPPGIGPPALSGSEGAAGGEGVPLGGATDGGAGAAGGGGLLAVPGSGEAGDAALDAVPQDVGPAGLIRVPVPDPRLRALWAAGGSPREGQGLAARFTDGRPGPWGFSLFYVLLVGLFGFVVFRLWGALGGLEAHDLDGQADPPERDT